MGFVFDMVFNFRNLIAAWYIWEVYKLAKRKSIPEKVVEKLQEKELDEWFKSRKKAKIVGATGWFIFLITHIIFKATNYVDTGLLVLNYTALGLMLLDPILSIRNNNKKLGVWSSTFL